MEIVLNFRFRIVQFVAYNGYCSHGILNLSLNKQSLATAMYGGSVCLCKKNVSLVGVCVCARSFPLICDGVSAPDTNISVNIPCSMVHPLHKFTLYTGPVFCTISHTHPQIQFVFCDLGFLMDAFNLVQMVIRCLEMMHRAEDEINLA